MLRRSLCVRLDSFVFVGLLLEAACSSQPSKSDAQSLDGMPAPVVMAVKQAKKDGQTTASVSTTVEGARSASLSEELAASSVMLVTAKHVGAVVTTGDSFVTWNVFAVDREIGPQTIKSDACFDSIPPTLQLASGEIAVGLLGGVKNVEGVTVTWQSADSSLGLQEGEKYLLLGVRCSAHQVQTRNPGYSFASVGPAGELRPLVTQSENVYPPFFRELMTLGSVEALARRWRN
jgi:hypothetical protein